jgi:hypothetical protein
MSASTADLIFESAWLKWAQATRHAQTFESLVDAWHASGADPVRAYRMRYQPARHGFAVIVDEVEPIPMLWRAVLGDIANNYRAALDHLAWALVSRGRTPPGSGLLTRSQETAVYFPISHTRGDFNAQIKLPAGNSRPKLPGVRRSDSAIVRRAQPYHFSAGRLPLHPLVLLSRINNGDKHQAIQPLWAHPDAIHFDVTAMHDCQLAGQIWKRRAAPLAANEEIALLPARRLGPTPTVELSVHITSTPTIVERVSVREWHVRTGILIFKLLREFSVQPESIHDLGAELVPLPAGF